MSDSITITPDPPPNNGQQAYSNTTSTIGTPQGVLVGVQPGQQVTTPQPQGQRLSDAELELVTQRAAQAVTPAIQQHGETLQTMEQRMAAMQVEIDAARTAREEAEATAAAAEQARLDAERAAAEQNMSAAELVGQVRAEMQEQFQAMQERAATSEALLERERHFQALEQYKANRLADPEIAAAVMPHLHPYITGTTEQEIEEAIARAAQTSNAITSEFQAYQQQYRQQAPGVSPTAPSTGPMEQQASQTTLNAQQIAALSEAEYARLRPQLLRSAGQSFRANQG